MGVGGGMVDAGDLKSPGGANPRAGSSPALPTKSLCFVQPLSLT